MKNVLSLFNKIIAISLMIILLVLGIVCKGLQIVFCKFDSLIQVKTYIPELIEIAFMRNINDAMHWLNEI